MGALLRAVALLAVLAGGALWVLTAPRPLAADALEGLSGDAGRGALVFAAAGCASCHMAEGSSDPAVLGGGRAIVSRFGTFRVPNISSDPRAGIGAWSDAEIANAVMRGISPDGRHYYPAFPYTAYARMTAQDMADLIAHLRSLPADATPNRPSEVPFPFSIRRALGAWKLIYGGTDWAVPEVATAEEERGRYLAEALAHCGECHTPRGALGGLDRARWLAGAPNPAGEGRIPNITPAVLTWDVQQIAFYLQSGLDPMFDSAGGEMAEVVRNLAQLPEADRLAIAAYLKAVPAVE